MASYRNITVRTTASRESHNVPSHLADPSRIVGEPLATGQLGTTVTSLYNTRMACLVRSKFMVRQLRIGTLIWERCWSKTIIVHQHLRFGFRSGRHLHLQLTVVSSMGRTRMDRLERTASSTLLLVKSIG